MPHTPFDLDVLTPEGEVYSGEAEMVSTRTTLGSIGILAHHEPLLATLEPTELRIYKSDDDVLSYAQGEGYLQVAGGKVLLLIQDAIEPDKLDRADLEERLKAAQGDVESAEEGSESEFQARRLVRRLEAFLAILASS